MEKQRARRLELPQIRGGRRQLMRVDLAERESTLGHLGRQGEVGPQRDFAVMLEGVLVGGQGPRHPRGQRARLTESRLGPALAQEQVLPGGGRRLFASVDRDDGAIRQAQEQETTAPEAGVVPVHHPEGEGCGDRGIDGVAAVLEGFHGRLGGQGMARCGDPGPAGRGCGPPRRREQQEQEQADEPGHATRTAARRRWTVQA